MSESLIYHPGRSPEMPGPLARYLPPLQEGVVQSWLEANVPSGAWVLDPFGASPQLAVEAAAAGYRVLVAASNPIARFLLEMTAAPPSEEALKAALAELAAARRGEERMEPHILSLYETQCDNCDQLVSAQAFLWEGEAETPYARIYQCAHCGHSGEFPVTPEDAEVARSFASEGLHQARALARLAPVGDPLRDHAEEALDAYLPRAVYALFTLINKLDGLSLSEEQRRLLDALLISACDRANTLWSVPGGRARPRRLTVPPRLRENNVWYALEDAVQVWARPDPGVSLTFWPDLPPTEGGICVYEGRFKDLTDSLGEFPVQAAISAFPRQNQAYWTLSALWAGWLWGREAVGPFITVLRRRRYDWGWHTTALHAALSHLASVLEVGTPFYGLIAESEPGFDGAAMIAADLAGFALDGVALRPRSGQTQFQWRRAERAAPASPPQPVPVFQDAAAAMLRQRGEPSSYLPMQAAAFAALVGVGGFHQPDIPIGDIFSQARNDLEAGFRYSGGFLRYGGSDTSLEIGHWWLRDEKQIEEPLADRVEIALVNHLIKNPGCTLLEADIAMCAQFPGLLTPGRALILATLESYGEQDEDGGWHQRQNDTPTARRADLEEITQHLLELGERLGFEAQEGPPLRWEQDGQFRRAFYVIASAILGEVLFQGDHPPAQSFVVLPGSRANLVMHKLHRDPRLREASEKGWRFLKFRQLRRLVESPMLTLQSFDEQVELDPLTYDEPQIMLL